MSTQIQMVSANDQMPLTMMGILAAGPVTSPPGMFSTIPNAQAWFSRALPYQVGTVKSSMDVGDIVTEARVRIPYLGDGVNYLYSPWAMLSAHSRFANLGYVITLWCVKSPLAPCRLRIRYNEVGHTATTTGGAGVDEHQKKPALEWDLSKSDTFRYVIKPTYFNPYKYSVVPTGTVFSDTVTTGTTILKSVGPVFPAEDIKFGDITIEIATRYQPGGLFPDTFTIYIMSTPLDPRFNTPVDCQAFKSIQI